MLGNRLKTLRIENNLTQKQLCLTLNMSGARYSQYETDKRQPNYEVLKSIANYYLVSTDYLLGLSNIKNSNSNRKQEQEIVKIEKDKELKFNILEKIQILCKEQGLSLFNLEQIIGFQKGSLDIWKKNSPEIEKLLLIADYFNISMDYLLDREYFFQNNKSKSIVIDEDWNAEELDEIRKFKEFLKIKRIIK
ncbi:MAG: helix-turn-helix domain-containing protein [Peptostreptococcaceae bacterium]|nr:helix-turn-helix domain-containing protein [Peptostreptococcaceae bacterium]